MRGEYCTDSYICRLINVFSKTHWGQSERHRRRCGLSLVGLICFECWKYVNLSLYFPTLHFQTCKKFNYNYKYFSTLYFSSSVFRRHCIIKKASNTSLRTPKFGKLWLVLDRYSRLRIKSSSLMKIDGARQDILTLEDAATNAFKRSPKKKALESS